MSLLNELKRLRRIGKGNHEFRGICKSIDYDVRGEFSALAMRWPKFSGDVTYPVPSGADGVSACSQYLHGDSSAMWDHNHPYGSLRYELLNWCIEQLENM